MPDVKPTNNPVPSDHPADARDNFKRIDEVVNLQAPKTSPTRTGKELDTFFGIGASANNQRVEIEEAAENQREQFDSTFTAQFAYSRVGNISDFVGDQLPEADKLNSYQYPDDSGEWYGPVQSQSFPITIPSNPSALSNWALVTSASQSWVSDSVSNENLLINPNFFIPSPDDIASPSATPTDYPAGAQIFLNVFTSGGVVGLTYINGYVSFTSGSIYLAVADEEAISRISTLTSSVSNFNGQPRGRGVSHAVVGGEYRVTVTTDALTDDNSNITLLGSVKLEQGSIATRHEIKDERLQIKDTSEFGGDIQRTIDDSTSNGVNAFSIMPSTTYLSQAITGVLQSIKGSGILTSVIMGADGEWCFDLTNNSPSNIFSSISDMEISGTENYSGPKGINLPSSFNTIIERVRFRDLAQGIFMSNSWVSKLEDLRFTHVVNPIESTIPNGSVFTHIYAQRFQGTGLRLVDGLAPIAIGIVMENGVESANGVNFQACQSAGLWGYYTEGEMGVDLVYSLKNQRRNINCTAEGLWLNSLAPAMLIDATQTLGLRLGGVTLQTPQGTHVVETSGFSDDITYVTNVIQVDQNANSFLGDVRGDDQPLISVGSDNTKIMITHPSMKYGDGTNADLSNIQNQTANDANGIKPRLYNVKPDWSVGISLDDFDAAASGSTPVPSSGGVAASEHYGSVKLSISGTVTASSGSQPFFTINVQNLTTGEIGQSISTSVPSSGDSIELDLHVNVAPGVNNLAVAISRNQGGGGTNTFNCTSVVML